jgi:hypothetical protein
MNETDKNELIKKLMNFHIVFIIDSDLSISFVKPEDLENLGEMGCAFLEDFSAGIEWARCGNTYTYKKLEEAKLEKLKELKELHIHHTISSTLEKFKDWVKER